MLLAYSGYLFFVVPAFAVDLEKSAPRKIYLFKENIMLQNNQILIGSGNNWIPIDQLSADQKGFYIINDGKNAALFQWECPRCGHDNWFWEDICWFCGYEN